MAQQQVLVTGLREFRSELRRLAESGEFEKELKELHYEIAEDVVSHAKPRFAALGAMGARVGATLRPARTVSAAKVHLGSASLPYSLGVEFGAGRNITRQRSTGTYKGFNQFAAHTGQTGRALYPTIRDRRNDTIEKYGDGIERIARRAFPD